jgi:hypothetical protein
MAHALLNITATEALDLKIRVIIMIRIKFSKFVHIHAKKTKSSLVQDAWTTSRPGRLAAVRDPPYPPLPTPGT